MRNRAERYRYARACGLSVAAARALAGRPAVFELARKLRELLDGPPLRLITEDKRDAG